MRMPAFALQAVPDLIIRLEWGKRSKGSVMSPDFPRYPKLRDLQPTPASQQGQQLLLLHDPLQLAEKSVLLPAELAPLLRLIDGSRDIPDLRRALRLGFGLDLAEAELRRWIQELDMACLLENSRSALAMEQRLEAYRCAPSRPPVLAGDVYPQDPGQLRDFLGQAMMEAEALASAGPFRGLISPHIDYARGAAVYASTWSAAAVSLQEADLLIILGTDHYGEDELITLTRQHYETPLGILPTDEEALQVLVGAIGEAEAFRGELRHRTEHSIELAAIWAQFLRDQDPLPILPILCGPVANLVGEASRPSVHRTLGPLLQGLRTLLNTRRALIVAAADLSHVGQAFGDAPIDPVAKAEVQQADERLLACIKDGDARRFLNEIVSCEDRNHVCGATPISLTLMALAPVRGRIVRHEFCPADSAGRSWVTVCGALLE